MIICRSPYRVSFFGGGTDYPEWFNDNGGAVLSTTIDKYCYVFCKELLPYFEFSIRSVYAQTELSNSIEDIEHPAIREVLRYLKVYNNIEIQHSGDLPARSGIGSSSAFVVSLLHSIYTLQELPVCKAELAEQAFHIERNILKECVGYQDQVACAYGGLNKITFSKDTSPKIERVNISKERKNELESKLMLFYLKTQRKCSDITKSYVPDLCNHSNELDYIYEMVDIGIDILKNKDINEFGLLLNEYWQKKKSLGNNISNAEIDYIYSKAMQNGALGGKLIGAGAGGFLLLFVPEEKQELIKSIMSKNYVYIPFNFDFTGSTIIYNDW